MGKYASRLLASTTPGPIVGDYEIVGRDFLAGLGDLDICAKADAEGYTRNIEGVEPPTRRWASAHFCPAAFHDDAADEGPAPRLIDNSCEDFNIQGRYRVTPDMAALGSIILHEMTHSNANGESVFGNNPPNQDVGGSLITDLNNGYGPINTRRIRAETPQLAKRNVDNYNGRFEDPIP
ncbi:hypothetical protein W97_03200 [Coniosporium apollinis CBS 100218]|uniref:Lysine-specific metallo-endopeptidase domain-containing protein n=1 Tax=Coniosporium apollinis (strain CBS 100218) TaxID=1168221 RepID=R7YQL8_CONA1|nr:uncharacterized protein W97_03200 [Coniosporium apollinis CBS 100218]EON63971.1 hypothetical protein W97_03200 [Coniosporium apollinis CBS 100218]